jgi:hypothetical protein
LVAQELVDQMPRLGGNAHVALPVTPSQHEALRLLRALPTSSPIGLYFATDSGEMDSDDTGNLRVWVYSFQYGLDLIALLQGQLCVVSHKCSSYWSVKEARMLPQLTS